MCQKSRVRSPHGVIISLNESKFGRVVKALALGGSLERGTGSNPVACSFFKVFVS